jgi:hypothetical protein
MYLYNDIFIRSADPQMVLNVTQTNMSNKNLSIMINKYHVILRVSQVRVSFVFCISTCFKVYGFTFIIFVNERKKDIDSKNGV